MSCENEYPVSASDLQYVHIIKKKLKKALTDLHATENIAMEYGLWRNRILGRDENGTSEGWEDLDYYKRRIATHKNNVAVILTELEETGALVRGPQLSFRLLHMITFIPSSRM